MKPTIENYCEEDSRVTKWEYDKEVSDKMGQDMYRCLRCKLYASKPYLKRMKEMQEVR